MNRNIITGAKAFSLVVACALVSGPAMAERQIRNTTQTNVNRNLNTNRTANVNTNVSRSANINTNVNVNRNVNVNDEADNNWHPVATAAAVTATAAVTAAAIGSITRSIPPSCVPVVVNGVTYQQCGTTWYQPQYAGTAVQYVVVAAPR